MAIFQVFLEKALHMHDWKTVYLIIRAYNEGNVQSLLIHQCELEDAKPSLAAQVYDLPYGYEDLDEIKDKLHSNQLGWVSRQLHDNEVEFSKDTSGIDGALHGSACADHDWWLQEQPSINCEEEISHVSCIKKRYTKENVVEFRNVHLNHGTKYYICVHASGGLCTSFTVCSNGFIIDTTPPLPGQVFIGHGMETAVHSDNTSILVHWQGFSDLEDELTLPYASGIREYYYAIGELQSQR